MQIDVLVDLDRLAWAGLIDATGARVDATAAENPAAFPLVVDRVLKGLPYDEETVGELLTGLGSMARTTVTNEDASYVLAQVGRQLRGLDVRRETLPVTYVRAGSARVAVTDFAAATEVTRELFPLALLEPGQAGTPRVVLQRAGATIGAATAARLSLVGRGLRGGPGPDRGRAGRHHPGPRARLLGGRARGRQRGRCRAGAAADCGVRRRCPGCRGRRAGRPGPGRRRPRSLIDAGGRRVRV